MQYRYHSVVQAAAKKDFHINAALNGVPLPGNIHSGSHPEYSARVFEALEDIHIQYGSNITPEIAMAELEALTSRIRTAIANNPGVNLKFITF